MKITLIKCMTLPENLKRIHGDVNDIFLKYFNKHRPEIKMDIYDAEKGQLPDSNHYTDGFLFSGSASSSYEQKKWINGTKKFIRQLHQERRKMVGICFGHQIIAEALGGKVVKSDQGWGVGVQSVSIKMKKDWMRPYLDNPTVLVSYQDQVEVLPPKAEVLGMNSHCRYFMFSIKNNVLGIQGHPEVEKELAAALFNSRINRLGITLAQKAIKSLENNVSSEIWFNWICNYFFNSKT